MVAPARKPAAQFLVLALLLAGCGFQLRGESTTGLRSLHVPGPSATAQEIRRTLAGGATRVLPTAEGAEATLTILSENRDKTVNTITGAGRVYDHALTLRVRYQMTVPGRDDPVRLAVREQLLFKDMQLELADRILRQVAIAKRDM